MSPEPRDLSAALSHEADAASARPVDLDAVLRGSRARRRGRRRAVVGATASIAGLLAVGGLVFAVGAMGPRLASSTADGPVGAESAESGADAGGSPIAPQDGAQFGEDLRLLAPETLNTCGAPIAPATDAASLPLTAEVEPSATAVAPGSESTVEVRVTNVGTTTVEGLLSAPAITVSDAGTTVWHPRLGSGAEGGSEAVAIGLAPGESVVLSGVFTASSCVGGGEEALGGPALEHLAPGAYGLSAAIAFTSSAGTAEGLIVSPAASVPVG